MATFTVPPATLTAGTYTFGPFTVPAGSRGVRVIATLSDADAGNESSRITAAATASYDGGSTYRPLASIDWQGGPDKDGTSPPPRPGFDVTFDTRFVPDHVRISVTLLQTFNVGATVTTY